MPASFPLQDAREALKARLPGRPEVFLVLGSGLGGLTRGLSGALTIPFDQVPGFPGAGVAGHEGRLLWGEMEGRRVLVQSGRFHLYEGHTRELVTAPMRLSAGLGARAVILTNAAGGIAPGLDPGAILLIRDYLDLMGPRPSGRNGAEGTRWPYHPELLALARKAAREEGVPLKGGTYAAVLGPSYETPAEVRALRRMGADAVGMSTVPEALAGAALGLPVLALSLITNRAAGAGGRGALSHEEVLETGRRAGHRLQGLIRRILRRLPVDSS